MGWGSLLGDFAKDFAKGYIQERGVQGTLEDIGSVARNFLSDDSGDSDVTNEFLTEYNNLIDNEKYSEAEAFVRRFYNNNDLDRDAIFYYTTAVSLRNQALNHFANDSLELAMKAKKNIDKAIRLCEKGTDDYKEASELRKSIEEAISVAQQQIRQLEAWNSTTEAFADLIDNGGFDEAESILMSYYKEFENGDLDWFYWQYIAKLHYKKHGSAENQRDAENEYSIFLQNIDKALTLTNDAEEVEQLSNMRKWDKLSPKTAEKDSVAKPSQSSVSDSEKEYIEEFKACLSEGSEISDRERRLLDRLRRSLGISEQRVVELEAMCNPKQLTQEEQEYADEFKACFEESGDITARERRLLDRLRNTLGIAESRAAEIEKNIMR